MSTRVIGLVLIFVACVSASGCVASKSQKLYTNKEIVLRSEAELWSKGNLQAAAELYSPNFVCHFLIGPDWKGIEGIKQAVQSHRKSFPDWNEHVDDIIAEGDEVVIRFTSTGTNLGSFQGMGRSQESSATR